MEISILNSYVEKCGLGIWGDSDCYICEITPGGLADRLGLKVGDTLISVNNKPLQREPYGTVMRILLPELNDPNGAPLTVQRAEFE